MKVLRVTVAVILTFCILFTAFYGSGKIVDGGVDTTPSEYKGILTLWQVDTFEGGVGSRKQFLLKSARGFEKQNEGVLVMVINHTAKSVKENLDKGVFPDMISYGAGLDISGMSELNVTRGIDGGKVGGKVYATAWCRGGYVLIKNPKITVGTDVIDNLIVSQSEFTQPLTAFNLSGYSVNTVEVLKPMDAYVKFTSGKVKYFLGTQRDLNRLNAREFEYEISPLDGYNDLFQYVSVTATDQTKRYYSEKFIEYLISDTVQSKLNTIGMFSPFIAVKYENAQLYAMQLANTGKTVSAFTAPEVLNEMQDLSLQATLGNKEALNKIKNLLL